MTLNEIVAVANFLGDSITEAQVDALMDEARVLSVAEREVLLANTDNATFFNLLSMNRAESRWELR
jgi:hypothetical protein